MSRMIEFGEWAPDAEDFQNEGVVTAKNVLPGNNHYEPVPSATQATDDSIPGVSKGAFACRSIDEDGGSFNFVATDATIQLLSSGSFTDVSIAGGYTGTDEDDIWDFCQVGNDVIATNYLDAIQTYNLTTSTLFANLGGSPPKARYLAKVNQFLVIANIYDAAGDGFVPQRVQWAGIGTIDSWTVSAATQADYQDLDNGGGWITGVTGGEFGGLVFQENRITRMTYVGSPTIFQFDEVKSASGAICRGGIINIGDFVAFIGQDGFYIFDGQTAIPIGANKINKYFFNDMDLFHKKSIRSFLYPERQIIGWSYRSSDADTPAGVNNKVIFYNFAPGSKKRWSIADIECSDIFVSLTEGYTLEQLDDYGAGSQTLETLPFSLDSDAYKGGIRRLATIDEEKKLTALNSTALDAEIQTGSYQLTEGKRSTVTLVRPFISGSPTTTNIEIFYKNLLQDDYSTTGNSAPRASGFCPVRASGRYHALELKTTGDFSALMGFSLNVMTPGGRR